LYVPVPSAFERQIRKTPKRDLKLTRNRLRALILKRRVAERSEGNLPMRLKVTRSSGNVFRDLGFAPEEAEHLQVRSDLMIQLQKLIASRGFTQAETAKILRVTQPRVSDLLRGRIDLCSTDTLIDMPARLGVQVKLVLRSPRRRLKVA
jgi:predicted XRE-type DNA-binding protein